MQKKTTKQCTYVQSDMRNVMSSRGWSYCCLLAAAAAAQLSPAELKHPGATVAMAVDSNTTIMMCV